MLHGKESQAYEHILLTENKKTRENSEKLKLLRETEGKIIAKNVTREGARAVLVDELKGFYLVAEENKSSKKIIGQLMVTFEWSDWKNKNIWWIQSVYIDKKYRNKKVFSQLYKTVTKIALSKKNVGGIRLYVEKQNILAKRVYESLGMKKTPYEIYEKIL